MFGKRILILAAHPDDEVVGCAACIGRARTQGASVSVLYLTDGCIARETLWPWQRKRHARRVERRRNEAEDAATAMGILPVGWGVRSARELWPQLPQVFGEVQTAIAQFRPDQIWVPAYEGGNPDHDGLNAVGAKLKQRLSVLEFSEYNFFEGKVRSQTFAATDESTQVVSLTPAEKAFKKSMLEIYESERGNLSAICTHQETYRPLANYDYSLPPHQGTLGYTRFQWVPFRHPRVDFTLPEEVSKAIVSFLP
ncbi:MAG: PIG-L family deacetylase [Alphaproteobacteria bacterium]|nr:PIG-L family deacetylase [Alphaproteobacteria bacterium]